MSIHYQHEGIATFPVTTETIFQYMRTGNHQHAAFRRYRLVDISDHVVTVDAEIYNPDGSTFQTTLRIRLDPPTGIEATMIGGPFDGARIKHTYTPMHGQTKVDVEGEFPAMPGMSEADELTLIEGFFSSVLGEDAVTLRTWSPAE
jgi:hypothetical protein